jgi:hypothetical protein
MTLRFFAGGGVPPQSHEVLRLEADGSGVYLTGMPWPEQEPFDEIGLYTADVRHYEELASMARGAIAAGSAGPRFADTGGESIALDGADASWSPRSRTPEATALVAAVRTIVGTARRHPIAAARARIDDHRLVLAGLGERALPVANGELRAGWGPADHVASPMRLAFARPVGVELPGELAPGASLTLALPDPGPVEDDEFATLNALVHVRWRPGVEGEPEQLDGWMIAG